MTDAEYRAFRLQLEKRLAGIERRYEGVEKPPPLLQDDATLARKQKELDELWKRIQAEAGVTPRTDPEKPPGAP